VKASSLAYMYASFIVQA